MRRLPLLRHLSNKTGFIRENFLFRQCLNSGNVRYSYTRSMTSVLEVYLKNKKNKLLDEAAAVKKGLNVSTYDVKAESKGSRERQCDEALGVLQTSLLRLERTCGRIGWDLDNVLKGSPMVTCPLSKGHRMPQKRLKEHKETCSLRHRGLSKAEIASLPPSSFPFYEKAPAVRSVVMTQDLQAQILRQAFGPQHVGAEKAVPPSPDRAVAELTSEERCAIYQHMADMLSDGISSDSQTSLLHELQQLEDVLEERETERTNREEQKRMKPSEVIAMERDFHRRRRTYRGVHTDRRSHTEVLREVITRQMELVKDVITARRLCADRSSDSPKKPPKRKHPEDDGIREEGKSPKKKKKKKDLKSSKKAKKSKKKKKKASVSKNSGSDSDTD